MLTGVIRKINNGVVGRGSTTHDGERNLLKFRCQNRSQQKVVTSKKNNPHSRNSSKGPSVTDLKLEEEKICRICRLNEIKTKENLISPCACKGTLAHIHRSCLEKWLKRSGTTYCELCRFNYTVKVIERYSKVDSIRRWLTDDDNFDDAQDLVVDMVLAVTFLPIVFICGYGFLAVCSETPRITSYSLSKNTFEIKQKLWVVFMLGCATVSILASYTCWIALRSAHYHRKWSSWVRRHGKLILILDKNETAL
ncbi:E3 ubiquitin-protein ligase MARCHF3-like [Planococcus citri]|uniref:E3 ubiquitin-protein ligase MARCHF3-like n=1 Tax=Planococcus citri TaxID=170843 RepID=UPI0031F9F560